mgnify:CR=1 FL=1
MPTSWLRAVMTNDIIPSRRHMIVQTSITYTAVRGAAKEHTSAAAGSRSSSMALEGRLSVARSSNDTRPLPPASSPARGPSSSRWPSAWAAPRPPCSWLGRPCRRRSSWRAHRASSPGRSGRRPGGGGLVLRRRGSATRREQGTRRAHPGAQVRPALSLAN